MKLNLEQLQQIAQETILSKQVAPSFKADVTRVFGPSIVVENCSIETIASQILDLLEACDRSGKTIQSLQTQHCLQLLKQTTPKAKRLAARLSPIQLAQKLAFDKDVFVRCEVAKRTSLEQLNEMCNKFPRDELLQEIKEQRTLLEFDAKNLQKISNTPEPELSDAWYYQKARRIIDDYGELSYGLPRRVDRSWKIPAIKQFCNSLFASYHIEVDQNKLLKFVDDILEELDEDRIPTLREIKQKLSSAAKQDVINESRIMPLLNEEDDSIQKLFKQRSNYSQFDSMFESVFKVQKTTLSGDLKLKMLQEGIVSKIIVPSKAFNEFGLNDKVESLVDTYVMHWNSLHENVVFKLNWQVDPTDTKTIIFGAHIL